MNPISWQNQTNGRKFVSLSIALLRSKTSHRLSNTLLDTDQYYSYVSGHKYWNYFSYVLSINLTDGMFSLVAIVTPTEISSSNRNSLFCCYDDWLFNRCVVSPDGTSPGSRKPSHFPWSPIVFIFFIWSYAKDDSRKNNRFHLWVIFWVRTSIFTIAYSMPSLFFYNYKE